MKEESKPPELKHVEEKMSNDKNSYDSYESRNHHILYSEPLNIDQEYCYETSECFTSDIKPGVKRSYKNKNVESEKTLEGRMIKEEIFSSVNQYKDSKAGFWKIYHKWLPERQNTLKKLQSLLKEVHNKTINYYKTQATFKELSYNSRHYKETTENQTVDFLASLAAFVSDAACGITSFAQTFEMDSYQIRFQEIMDHDSEITKDLYASRSQCVSQYEGIEEVIRKFHPNTLPYTVDKISDSLLVHKHWAAIKNAYDENNMTKLLDEVSKFFNNACQTEVLQSVGASISEFVADHPTALEACKSTGRVVYGAMDAFSEKDKSAAVEFVNKTANLYLMLEDKREIDHLNRIINEDNHQSKLESQIQEAIDSLKDEMKEMKELYSQMFDTYSIVQNIHF